jgi:hypothetical protein
MAASLHRRERSSNIGSHVCWRLYYSSHCVADQEQWHLVVSMDYLGMILPNRLSSHNLILDRYALLHNYRAVSLSSWLA